MHIILFSVILTFSLVAQPAQVELGSPELPDPAVVPQPVEMERLAGAFAITESTIVFIEADKIELRDTAKFLASLINARSSFQIPVRPQKTDPAPGGSILLTTAGADPALGDEGYELTISGDSILVRAPRPAGLFYGVQTIRQLLPPTFEDSDQQHPGPWMVPCVHIVDKPRYGWRGMLLDCGRHFMSKDFVKRYIDLLAYHKMNVLHWHLTEDQGWRIEIKKYPRLTELGAWRGSGDERYGGFYTQDDIREIVAYAHTRHVTVVPEIELPGHCQAALAAYPELSCTGGPHQVSTRWGVHTDVYCAGNDETFEFLENVLTEVLDLFPSEFIHIGGDEVPKTRWKDCSNCQQRIASEELKDEDHLQSYFVRRIEAFLNGKGRRLIGWDEILEGGLAPNATVQSWRGMNGAIAAAKLGHDVVSSPTSHCYLDYSHDAISLRRIYAFEPTPRKLSVEEGRHILGAEGNIWTERAPQERVDHQVFPRLSALAEVTWSPKNKRSWYGFSKRMKTHYRRLDGLGVNYYISPPQCPTTDRVFASGIEVSLEDPLGRGDIHYTLDGSEPNLDAPRFEHPLRFQETTLVTARTFLPNGNRSEIAVYPFVKQQPRESQQVAGLTPGLSCEYFEGQWREVPDFNTLQPADTMIARVFEIPPQVRAQQFALRFNGYIDAPEDSVYTFHVESDDGSQLLIGSDVVVDHDGLHSASEQRGQIILRKGMHPISVLYFQAGGAAHLQVSIEAPRITKQPLPATILWRSAQ